MAIAIKPIILCCVSLLYQADDPPEKEHVLFPRSEGNIFPFP